MINNSLQVELYGAVLARDGRVQIRDFLQPSAAERLWRCLAEEVPWATAERGESEAASWQGGALERHQTAYARAAEGFHFVYDRYLMVEALRHGRDQGLVLHSVLVFLNSQPFLDFIRYLTGDRGLNMVGAQATRYLPGQFLRQHDDHHAEEGRRYAYVINLSRRWEADWGGLLHFVDSNGAVDASYVPWWNSLSLFRVPAEHYVGQVAPWAAEPRLAITGWWHAK